MCVYGSDKVIKYLHINITFLVYLLVTNADIETKKSKLVKSRDLKKKIINWYYNNTEACIVSGSFHQHSWTYLKKKSICKIKTCKEINGCTVVLLYQHTQIAEMSIPIIEIYKCNGVWRTKRVEFGRGHFVLLYTKSSVYRYMSILKFSIVYISCTNK